ncbi:hypothetical protein E2C01_039194 [Portunus trituberculatus]|uniref:Secreted protein n=1 Tax=Portunus trituberculatus TaxID=210409 RepID=A0A5B7FJ10_PORTR|nr:hypothetical protein [Portunus trituberculatus]
MFFCCSVSAAGAAACVADDAAGSAADAVGGATDVTGGVGDAADVGDVAACVGDVAACVSDTADIAVSLTVAAANAGVISSCDISYGAITSTASRLPLL